MKKPALIITALIIVVLGVYYLVMERRATVSPPETVVSTPALPPPPQGQIDPSSLFNRLQAQVFFAGQVNPQHWEPALNQLKTFWAKLTATAAWKKVNPEQVAQTALNNNQGTPAADVAALTSTLPQALEIAGNWWQGLGEVVMAASSDGFQLTPEVKLPSLFLAASMRNPELVASLTRFIDTSVLNSQPTSTLGPLTISKHAGDGASQLYELSLAGDTPVTGQMELAPNQISVLLGARAKPLASAGDSPQTLTKAPAWPAINQGLQPEAGSFLALQVKEASPFIEQLIKLNLPAQNSEQLEAAKAVIESTLSEFQSVGASLALGQGLNARECVLLNPGSKLLTRFNSFSASRPPRSSSSFYKIISDQTLLALQASKPFALFQLESVKDSYAPPPSAPPEKQADWEKFKHQLDQLMVALRKVPFQEAGLVVNLAPGAFFPEFGVYLGGSDKISLQALAGAFNESMAALATPAPDAASGVPQAKIGRDQDGRERVEIALGDGSSIIAVPVGDSIILASASQNFIDAGQRLLGAQTQPFMAGTLETHPELGTEMSLADVYLYLSTHSVLPMARMFFPMLAANRPDLNLTPAELDEFLNLVDFSVFSVQRSYLASAQNVCSQAKILAF